MRDRYVEINELRLHYLEWGDPSRRPFLLLHGLSGFAHDWDPLCRALENEYHLLALDQRGHGESDWATDYHPDRRVEDLEQFVAAVAGAALEDLAEHGGEALANARNLRDLPRRIPQNLGDALRVALHGGGAVAVTADAEAVVARDLHQVGGFPEDAGDLLVLHWEYCTKDQPLGSRTERRYKRLAPPVSSRHQSGALRLTPTGTKICRFRFRRARHAA